jgi:hypothetical protein
MRTSWVRVSLLAGLMVVVASTGTMGAPRKDGRPKGSKPGVTRKADREAYPRDGKGADTDRRRTGTAAISPADQVIPDDLIVQSSLCVGFDCVLNENFGFDTIRLKENNLRIAFQDTSVGAFPSNDWELTANDSASGGQNRFSITDVTGAKTPFTVEAGARNAALVVDVSGNIGIGTSDPVLDVHVTTSDTPGQRLEQTAAGGFTAQTWDVAGNEANFFVRDVTSGSRLPFRIRPGAPTSSIDIAADGEVGMGTASPDASLHLSGVDTPRVIRLQQTGGTTPHRWDIGGRADGSFKIHSGVTGQFDLLLNDQALFRLRPAAQPPTRNVALGAMYSDQSGALCWYDGAAWLKIVGAGTCQ